MAMPVTKFRGWRPSSGGYRCIAGRDYEPFARARDAAVATALAADGRSLQPDVSTCSSMATRC